jgi:hypothetical protein
MIDQDVCLIFVTIVTMAVLNSFSNCGEPLGLQSDETINIPKTYSTIV